MVAAKIVRKFLGVALLRIASIPLVLGGSVIVARILEVEDFGQYSFYMSLIPLLALPVSGGLSQLLTREISGYVLHNSRDLCRGLIFSSVFWVSLTACITLAVLLLLSDSTIFVRQRLASSTSLVMMTIVFVLGLNAVLEGVLRGFKYPVYANLSEQVFKPILFIFFIGALFFMQNVSLQNVLLAQAGSGIVALLVVVMVFLGLHSFSLDSAPRHYDLGSWIKGLIPFLAISVVYTSGTHLGIAILGWIGTNEDVAALRVAERGVQLVSLPLVLVNVVVAPYVVEHWNTRNLAALQRISKLAALGAFSLSLPVALVFIFFGRSLIDWVFGASYADISYPPLVILSIAHLVNVFFGSVGLLLSMTGFERYTLAGQTFALVISVSGCLVLIPLYGALGAAIGIAAGLISWNITLGVLVSRHLKIRPGLI